MQINRHRLKPPLESSSGCEEKRNEKGMKRFWKISITPSFPSPSSWSLRCELIAQELLFNWPSICTAPWRLILAGQREEEEGKKGWQMGSVSLRYPVIRSDQLPTLSLPLTSQGRQRINPSPFRFGSTEVVTFFLLPNTVCIIREREIEGWIEEQEEEQDVWSYSFLYFFLLPGWESHRMRTYFTERLVVSTISSIVSWVK